MSIRDRCTKFLRFVPENVPGSVEVRTMDGTRFAVSAMKDEEGSFPIFEGLPPLSEKEVSWLLGEDTSKEP